MNGPTTRRSRPADNTNGPANTSSNGTANTARVNDTAEVLAEARNILRQARIQSEWIALLPGACSVCGESDIGLDYRDLCKKCSHVVDLDTADQLRRRRVASWRLPPMATGRRDPLGPITDGVVR